MKFPKEAMDAWLSSNPNPAIIRRLGYNFLQLAVRLEETPGELDRRTRQRYDAIDDPDSDAEVKSKAIPLKLLSFYAGRRHQPVHACPNDDHLGEREEYRGTQKPFPCSSVLNDLHLRLTGEPLPADLVEQAPSWDASPTRFLRTVVNRNQDSRIRLRLQINMSICNLFSGDYTANQSVYLLVFSIQFSEHPAGPIYVYSLCVPNGGNRRAILWPVRNKKGELKLTHVGTAVRRDAAAGRAEDVWHKVGTYLAPLKTGNRAATLYETEIYRVETTTPPRPRHPLVVQDTDDSSLSSASESE